MELIYVVYMICFISDVFLNCIKTQTVFLLFSQGVCLVLSVTSKAALLQTLAAKRGAVLFSLGQLTMPDRKKIVQKELDTFGKKLSDSAFNNQVLLLNPQGHDDFLISGTCLFTQKLLCVISQLQTLITKKGAASPLYLHLACEDLRSFASFDKV